MSRSNDKQNELSNQKQPQILLQEIEDYDTDENENMISAQNKINMRGLQSELSKFADQFQQMRHENQGSFGQRQQNENQQINLQSSGNENRNQQVNMNENIVASVNMRQRSHNQFQQQRQVKENVVIRFEFEDEPEDIHSVSSNFSLLKQLYYLSPKFLLANVQKIAIKLITGNIYMPIFKSKVSQSHFNTLDIMPKLLNQKAKVFEQFFHNINILMGSHYFICREQMIQHSMIFLRDSKDIEKAILYNSMFPINHFCPIIAKRDRNQFYLEKLKSLVREQFYNNQQELYKLNEIFDCLRATPLLIQVFDNANARFLVVKKIQNNWFYFDMQSQIFKITNEKQNQLRSFAENYKHISEIDFVEKNIGTSNIIYGLKQCQSIEMRDQIKIGQILNQFSRDQNYNQLQCKWAELYYYALNICEFADLQQPTFSSGPFKVADASRRMKKDILAANKREYKRALKKMRGKSKRAAKIEKIRALRSIRMTPEQVNMSMEDEEYSESSDQNSDPEGQNTSDEEYIQQ